MNNDILVVEDDDFKLERLSRTLLEADPSAAITVAKSVRAAIEKLGREYRLIILDMALPSHPMKPGTSPATSLPSGGIEILLELAYTSRSDKVVVVTQFQEIEIEERLVPTRAALDAFLEQGMDNVIAVLHYMPEADGWAAELKKIASLS